MTQQNILPVQAFDSQIFIDAFRIKWQFDGANKCWRRVGTVTDIPAATELQPGLLTARLKQLLDGIPEGAGHFGIISQPLLSFKPQFANILLDDVVDTVSKIKSGTRITGRSVCDRSYNIDHFAGKILKFQSGILASKVFLIFTNDKESIFLEGDASHAKKDDKFIVVDPAELNPSGVLLGDINLVSESIDIECVDGNGVPLPDNCNIDIIQCDVGPPPALNFQVSDEFIESLCVTIPGCKGPRGDRGPIGEAGLDGTGDGPQGEPGDPGQDAPIIPNTFTGIKIVDTDDVADTAVVALELDASNNKLSVVKAKVRTPDDTRPATQLITTPINRSVKFSNNKSFDYEILMPNGDPIGKADIDLLKYPDRFSDANTPTNVSKVKLSNFIDQLIQFWTTKLEEINDSYNRELKAFIEGKDEQARIILADLAQLVAECEFELPIDFCLGLTPDDCHPENESQATSTFLKNSFVFPYAETLFGSGTGSPPPEEETVTALDLGTYTVIPTTTGIDLQDHDVVLEEEEAAGITLGPGASSLNTGDVLVKFPDPKSELASTTLPPGGYVIQCMKGSIRSNETDWLVGSTTSGMGLEAVLTDLETDATVVRPFPVPGSTFNSKEQSSVEQAYIDAPITDKTIAVQFGASGGNICLRAPLPGSGVQGSVDLKILHVDIPAGSSFFTNGFVA